MLLSGAENQKAHSEGEGNGGDAHYQVHLALPDLRQELKIQASDSRPPAEAWLWWVVQ